MKQLFHLVGIVGILMLLSGCGTPYYLLTTDKGSEFRPRADGAAAAEGADATIDGLHLAYAQRDLRGGIHGPGKALFFGPLLRTFTMDGSLSRSHPTPAPGFFDVNIPGVEVEQRYFGNAGLDPIISWGSWFNVEAALGSRDRLVYVGGPDTYAGRFEVGAYKRSFYYVLGIPTPVLPQQGVAVYSMIGTEPSYGFTSVPFGRLSVTWGTVAPKVGLDFNLIGDIVNTWRIQTTGGIENTVSSEVTIRPGTATFAGVGIPVSWRRSAGNPQGEPAPFTVSVEGFFAGPAAERAGLTYWSQGRFAPAATAMPDEFAGNAVFALQSLTSGGTGGTGGTGGSSSFTAPLDTSSPPLAMVYAGPAGGLVDQSTDVTAITQDGTTGLITSYTKTGIDTYVKNTAQGADVGGDALITWGRWTNGTPQLLGTGGGSYDGATIGVEQGFHYVIGKPSPSLPATGTANFTLLGATKPTFSDGSASFPAGTLTSTGPIAMAVEWGGTAATKLGVDLTVTMPNDVAYRIQTPGGIANPGDGANTLTTGGSAMFSGFSVPVTTTGVGRACSGGACDATIKGLFSGTDGARAGLVYTVKSTVGPPGLTPNIVGAATFTKQ